MRILKSQEIQQVSATEKDCARTVEALLKMPVPSGIPLKTTSKSAFSFSYKSLKSPKVMCNSLDLIFQKLGLPHMSRASQKIISFKKQQTSGCSVQAMISRECFFFVWSLKHDVGGAVRSCF